jgi:hypothetical protein
LGLGLKFTGLLKKRCDEGDAILRPVNSVSEQRKRLNHDVALHSVVLCCVSSSLFLPSAFSFDFIFLKRKRAVIMLKTKN